MKKYLKKFYDAGTIAFHYTILYSLYSVFRYPNEVDTVTWTWNQIHGAKSVLWLTLAQPFSRASVEFLPVYTPSSEEKEDPTLYATNVSQKSINYHYPMED